MALLLLVFVAPVAIAEADCDAPPPVCDARSAIVGVSAFDPYGSGVRIGDDLIVTNRHVIADESHATLRLPDGSEVTGEVVPTAFEGDLILVRAKLPPGPALAPEGEAAGALYTVGQDVSSGETRVFPEGRVLVAPEPGKPYARLHHTAYTQPGNSGGALLTAEGELVGIAASGGEGRFEAVPAQQIARLRALSGPEHAARSVEIGRALRDCTLLVEKAMRSRGGLAPEVAQGLTERCTASGNRQLFDLAGQMLGRARAFDASVALFNLSLDKDPGAINARLGLVVTLFLARRYAEAAPHVRQLVAVIPQDPQLHRFAIQVGKFADQPDLMRKGLELVARHDPARLEAAKRFVDAPMPAPRRR